MRATGRYGTVRDRTRTAKEEDKEGKMEPAGRGQKRPCYTLRTTSCQARGILGQVSRLTWVETGMKTKGSLQGADGTRRASQRGCRLHLSGRKCVGEAVDHQSATETDRVCLLCSTDPHEWPSPPPAAEFTEHSPFVGSSRVLSMNRCCQDSSSRAAFIPPQWFFISTPGTAISEPLLTHQQSMLTSLSLFSSVPTQHGQATSDDTGVFDVGGKKQEGGRLSMDPID